MDSKGAVTLQLCCTVAIIPHKHCRVMWLNLQDQKSDAGAFQCSDFLNSGIQSRLVNAVLICFPQKCRNHFVMGVSRSLALAIHLTSVR